MIGKMNIMSWELDFDNITREKIKGKEKIKLRKEERGEASSFFFHFFVMMGGHVGTF
jgi:hypothetical protein